VKSSTEAEVESLFTLAGIPILKKWELMNQYWPRVYKDLILENPWWLVKTEVGCILVGPRKRVVSIDWSDTPIRKIVTDESVTKSETLVHAWSVEDALKYLKVLAVEIKRLQEEKTLDELDAGRIAGLPAPTR